MKKTSKLTTVLLFLILFAGLSLLLYPFVSEYWNALHQSRAIASYSRNVALLDEDSYTRLWESASAYNASLPEKDNIYFLEESQREVYDQQLNIFGTGIMGYIEIPAINCSLPIYHGTGEAVLQVAVGHLEWSSLPVGGESTHCVVSGHRGLPSARLFTDLDKLAEGDVFMLRVLDEVLTYEVDQILIVEPDQVADLQIVEGQDYCTLVTCTPYGVNSHRLLVRGYRIENQEEAKAVRVMADAVQLEPLMVAPIVAIPLLLLLMFTLILPRKPINVHGGDDDEEV